MRKRTFLDIFDTVLWQVLGLMPLIYVLICAFGYAHNDSVTSMPSFNQLLGNYMTSAEPLWEFNAFYNVLKGIFYYSTYDLMIVSPEILYIVSYYATVQLIHLVVDCLLFVPMCAKKLMKRIVC